MTMDLQMAEGIIEGALETASGARMKPLGVVVLGAGGHLVAFKRQNGASFIRFDIARAKAWTALGLQMSSRGFQEMADQRPHFAASLNAISNGRVAPAAGGILVERDGTVIGAVGVSGDTPDNDEKAALAGARASDLAELPTVS